MTLNSHLKNTKDFLLEANPIAYSMSKFFLERGTGIWGRRKDFDLKGAMYKWEHDKMKSTELDEIIKKMFLDVSRNQSVKF